jgi:tRNA uridine 5-carbamoylmethylation protein Kti12
MTLYINSCLPLFIDATSADPSGTVKRYNILENLGYDMALVFVNTSLETAMERNRSRKRIIPDETVKDYYAKVQKMKGFLRTKFPLFMEIKNDVGELTDEVITHAFKKMEFFYDSPIKNPIGQQTIQKMRDNGWKYLVPEVYSMAELKQMVSQWYRSAT